MLVERDYILRVFIVGLLDVVSVSTILFTIYLFLIVNTLYDFIIVAVFAVLVLVSSFFNIYSSMWYYKSYKYEKLYKEKLSKVAPLKVFPTVAIAMPVYNEDPKIVKNNIEALLKINYPKEKIKFYVLDDTTDIKNAKQIEEVALKNRIMYLHRDVRTGYKAGALNNMLKYSNEEFIAIFDSDEKLTNRDFLIDTLPYFRDKDVAYVQTEKRFQKGNFFSDAVDIFEAFFFKFVQAGRALNNTTIFAGSCGVIRRSAIDTVGGFPQYVLEDTFFSFDSILKGYKNVYIPKNYALGQPLKSFTALAKQQWRYNYGGTQFIKYFIDAKKENLSKSRKIDYFLHGAGLDYVSIFLIIFSIVSIGIVFIVKPLPQLTDISAIVSNPLDILEIMGMIAFIGSFFAPVVLSGLYFKSYKKGVMVSLLNYALAIIRTKAAIALFLNKEPGHQWNKTDKRKIKTTLYSIYAAKSEIAFSAFIWIFAYIAINSANFYGGLWLIGYGLLFSLTAIFIKIYG
ncbi:MAG: glycosyltransferase [Candidatus Micrarchaeia archaeon]